MKAVVQGYWLPKAGNSLEEYEDAYWPPKPLNIALDSLRIAVSDGATETSFSGLWARLLSKAYCRRRLSPNTLGDDLRQLARVWKRCIGKRPLPWYAEQKLESGAFAAVAGIEINANNRWSAFAIGDSCVFQTRDSALVSAFPLDKPELFDNRPLLVSSMTANNDGAIQNVKTIDGAWIEGDTFYLMSDAIAQWFLTFVSLPATDPVEHLRSIKDQGDFETFVSFQRKDSLGDGAPAMRNDDVTLIACTVT